MKIKGKVCDVQWDDSEGVELMKSHTDFLEPAYDKVKGDTVMALYLANEPWFDDRGRSIRMILPILEVGSARSNHLAQRLLRGLDKRGLERLGVSGQNGNG